MKMLWTFVKVVLALAVLLPLGIIALAMALGILGALVGLAVLTLKLALVGVVIWLAFRFVMNLFGSRHPRVEALPVRPLPPVDPYYEAAKRELDRELGESR